MLKKIIGLIGSGFLFSLGAVLAIVFGIIAITVVAKVADDPIEMAIPMAKTENGVLILPLEGEILTSEKFRRLLAKAVERKDLHAIVVAIDSPGGAVGASEEIYRAIVEANKKKPVLCSLSNVAASGGLYSAMGCRKIIANRGTLTGSIGVIMSYPTIPQVMEKVGVEMNVVKSGVLKDIGSPFRHQTPEDKAFLTKLVLDSYEQFVGAVAKGRNLPVEKVKSFADGRVMLGEQAKELGLIDELGGVEQAAKLALEAAGKSVEPELVYLKKKGSFSSFLDVEESKVGRLYRALFSSQLLYRSEIS